MTEEAAPTPDDNTLARRVQDLEGIIAHMLWQRRIEAPELAVHITEKDRTGFLACTQYLKVGTEVRYFPRRGRLLVQLVDAASKPVVRRQVAAKGKDGADIVQAKDVEVEMRNGKPVVQPGDEIVSIGDAIRPIEDNEPDFDAAEKAERMRQAKNSGMRLAAEVKAAALAGTFSKELVAEVCDNAMLLAGQ